MCTCIHVYTHTQVQTRTVHYLYFYCYCTHARSSTTRRWPQRGHSRSAPTSATEGHSALSGRTESRIIDFLTLDLLRDQRLPLNRLQLFAVIAATNHAVDVSREIDALFAWHDVRASSKVRGAMLNSISTFDLFFVFKKYEMPAAALCCCLVVQHNFRIERPPQGRG